jgi:hypothetical protein
MKQGKSKELGVLFANIRGVSNAVRADGEETIARFIRPRQDRRTRNP